MKIAIDVRPLQTSIKTGVGEYASELLTAVFSLYPEHEYFLCSSGTKPWSMPLPWQKPNIFSLHLSLPNKIINSAILLGNYPRLSVWPNLLGKKINFDWIYFPNLNFIAPEPRCKTIITIHDASFALFPEYFSIHRRLWHQAVKPQKIINSVSKITTPSISTLHDVTTLFNISPEKTTVIYPGLCSEWVVPDVTQLEVVKKKYNLPDNFILSLGAIEPRKNIQGAIMAFAEWQKNNPDATLIIAGAPGWKNKSIFSLIKKTPNVRFIGYVSDTEKPALYSLAQIFLYPSFYEGFGLPVLEAMRAGTPVITSHCSALPEVAGTAAYTV
ncbi:MAG: glycosyltransferase family 4 protein, partial [Candidatus Magasanikbacteria bacterium]|nr:glycosyltransferase family 4 protein [Candidatus Magasanikbacteria bacterium]